MTKIVRATFATMLLFGSMAIVLQSSPASAVGDMTCSSHPTVDDCFPWLGGGSNQGRFRIGVDWVGSGQTGAYIDVETDDTNPNDSYCIRVQYRLYNDGASSGGWTNVTNQIACSGGQFPNDLNLPALEFDQVAFRMIRTNTAGQQIGLRIKGATCFLDDWDDADGEETRPCW